MRYKTPSTHWIGSWVDLTAGLNAAARREIHGLYSAGLQANKYVLVDFNLNQISVTVRSSIVVLIFKRKFQYFNMPLWFP